MIELCGMCGEKIGIARVSICLTCAAKKSVSLEWLEKKYDEIIFELEKEFEDEDGVIPLEEIKDKLFSAAKKQAGEGK